MEERHHGDVIEHRHDQYEYWHPATRVHIIERDEIQEEPRGLQVYPFNWAAWDALDICPAPVPTVSLQVYPFNWAAWDAGCHAKGICQGYHSVPVNNEDTSDVENGLHHRNVAPELQGIAETYWQCPHCKELQKPIQWIQGARLENYFVEKRGDRVVIWVKVSSGAWFVLVTHSTLQSVAMGVATGTVYFCDFPSVAGDKAPMQLPDECATILARRMWYRLTKGYWSDAPQDSEV